MTTNESEDRLTVIMHCYNCSAMFSNKKYLKEAKDGRRYCRKCFKLKRSN